MSQYRLRAISFLLKDVEGVQQLCNREALNLPFIIVGAQRCYPSPDTLPQTSLDLFRMGFNDAYEGFKKVSLMAFPSYAGGVHANQLYFFANLDEFHINTGKIIFKQGEQESSTNIVHILELLP